MSSLCTGKVARSSRGGRGVCRKKPIRLRTPEPPQFLAERNQMVVMGPDDVVGPQPLAAAGKIRREPPDRR